MDRNIEKIFTPQLFLPYQTVRLQSYPANSTMVNPGIGGAHSNYDYYLPVYGKQDIMQSKKDISTSDNSTTYSLTFAKSDLGQNCGTLL